MKKYAEGYREHEYSWFFDDAITFEYDYEEIAELRNGKIRSTSENLEKHYDEILKFAFNHDLGKCDIEEE